jgi:formamidopyrimidine-DNA glycosylase
MPELPEVEIVRRGLAPAMEGRAFSKITLNRADLRFPFGEGFARRLQSERVVRLSRRAKYIIAETESGLGLAMHLGMTGRFTIARGGSGEGMIPNPVEPFASAILKDPLTQPSPQGERAFRLQPSSHGERAFRLHPSPRVTGLFRGPFSPGGEGQDEGGLAKRSTGFEETPGAFYYDYDADPRHDHVLFAMSSGDLIRYNDVRRFGYMTLVPLAELDAHPHFKGLGVEPLSPELNPAYLMARAKGKAQPLKAFLLDQRIVAGLGNIYVCEALFRAGLPPDALAGVLAKGRKGAAAAERLCRSIKGVLEDALLAGGSSIRDYRHADGAGGGFQEKFDVYGRKGEPCHHCGSAIERKVQQGRSTFFCPRCQSRL